MSESNWLSDFDDDLVTYRSLFSANFVDFSDVEVRACGAHCVLRLANNLLHLLPLKFGAYSPILELVNHL